MKRRLTAQEQMLIWLGGLVILLLLVYAAVTGATRPGLGRARQTLEGAEDDYKAALALRERYQQLGRLIDERKQRIAQRDPNFDLLSFIGEVERDLKFEHRSVTSPVRNTFAGGKYTRLRVTYVYDDKWIGEIVKFLHRIENPEHGIIISNFHLVSRDKDEGEKFTASITFSVVTERSTGE